MITHDWCATVQCSRRPSRQSDTAPGRSVKQPMPDPAIALCHRLMLYSTATGTQTRPEAGQVGSRFQSCGGSLVRGNVAAWHATSQVRGAWHLAHCFGTKTYEASLHTCGHVCCCRHGQQQGHCRQGLAGLSEGRRTRQAAASSSLSHLASPAQCDVHTVQGVGVKLTHRRHVQHSQRLF